jgi:hypothetical protein
VLTLADGAILFTGAALFRQVALSAMGRTLHRGLSGKLYLSMGGRGKAKVTPIYSELLNSGSGYASISDCATLGVKGTQNSVSVADVNELLQLPAKVGFWFMPSVEHTEQKTDSTGRIVVNPRPNPC